MDRPRLIHRASAILLVVTLAACSTAGPTGPLSSGPAPTASPAGSTLPDLGLANIVTDNATAVGAVIGSAGGTLTANAANGTQYSLSIPEGAIEQDTTIGMYPVTSIKTLAPGASVIGAVHFTPEGLQLRLPAVLTISPPPGTDTTKVVGFGYEGDGQKLETTPAIVEGPQIKLRVAHFSGRGAGRAFGDIVGETVMNIISDPNPNPNMQADVVAALRAWYRDTVAPALGACTYTFGSFDAGTPCDITGNGPFVAEFAYDDWLLAVQAVRALFPGLRVDPEEGQARVLARTHIADMYAALNKQCGSLSANPVTGNDAHNPLLWAGRALDATLTWTAEWQLPITANLGLTLNLETLLNNLCVRVVIDPSRGFTATRPGETGLLKVPTGFTIRNAQGVTGPLRHDLPIQVKATGASADAVGVSDSTGLYSVSLTWPAGVDPLRIDVLANINHPNVMIQRIAVFDRITKSTTQVKLGMAILGIGGVGDVQVDGVPVQTLATCQTFRIAVVEPATKVQDADASIVFSVVSGPISIVSQANGVATVKIGQTPGTAIISATLQGSTGKMTFNTVFGRVPHPTC